MEYTSRLPIYNRVADEFEKHGWTRLSEPRPSCIAFINVETAAGGRRALAEDFWPSEEGQLKLTGNYTSEGRNILESTIVDIKLDGSEEAFEASVKLFVTQAMAKVNDSYARRLYLNR